MAAFQKRVNGKWQAKIRRDGHPPVSKTFATKADAEAWARAQEREMDRGAFIPSDAAHRTTVGAMLDRYREEVFPRLARGGKFLQSNLERLKASLGALSLAALEPTHISTARDNALKAGLSSQSVRHNLGLLNRHQASRMFHDDTDAPVRLLDASEGFHDLLKERSTQARLKGWREVAGLLREGRSDRVRLLGGQAWPGARRLAPGETVPEEHLFLEAAIRDIETDGLLRRPVKGLVYSGALSEAQRSQVLRPGDILFCCKGAVGKVALAPEDCGPNWIPSQSFQVLRPRDGADPICLFHQLRSREIQEHIARLVTGGTVPQIKTADMGDLPVPTLSPDEAERIRSSHAEILSLSQTIRQLEKRRDLLLKDIVG